MRLPLLVIAVLAALAAPALAAKGPTKAQKAAAKKVIVHCSKGQSLKRDSTSALLLARRTLPADVAEYSDCPDRIARALKARHYVRPVGRDRVASVLADCRDGYIDHRFRRTTLQRANRHLRAKDTACKKAIARELRH
jgi:hypothetical protein